MPSLPSIPMALGYETRRSLGATGATDATDRQAQAVPVAKASTEPLVVPPPPWWISAQWAVYLRDLLLFRSRRRYTLSVTPRFDGLGATNPHTRQVWVNPTQLAFPLDPAARALMRGCPLDAQTFEQVVTRTLVEHEAAHIRFSGAKPAGGALAWLWNALEDERIERLLVRQYPDLGPLFTLLGDAVWRTQEPTTDLVAGCLLWRWEHDRALVGWQTPPDTDVDVGVPNDAPGGTPGTPRTALAPRFLVDALPPDAATLWQEQVRPLVERAWQAKSSDAVMRLARRILRLLGVQEARSLPAALAAAIAAGALSAGCACDGGLHDPSDPSGGVSHAPSRAGKGAGKGAGAGKPPRTAERPVERPNEGGDRGADREDADEGPLPSTAPHAPRGSWFPTPPPDAEDAEATGAPPAGQGSRRRRRRAPVGSSDEAHPRDLPDEADPTLLLREVEGAARDLARALAPPRPPQRRLRPHPSRGDLEVERASQGDERPFDAPTTPLPPPPTRAWFLVVDLSDSVGRRSDPRSFVFGSLRLALWLDRATELAGVAWGVNGFDGGQTPIPLRPLARLTPRVVGGGLGGGVGGGVGAAAPLDVSPAAAWYPSVEQDLMDQGRRRLAGMSGAGSTTLAPTLRASAQALVEWPGAQRKLLIVTLDGELDQDDADEARAVVAGLSGGLSGGRAGSSGLTVVALALGDDPELAPRLRAVFPHTLVCPTVNDLAPQVVAWLRATGA